MVRTGARADLVVFDPERVGAGEVRTARDLPGGSARLVADANGIDRVFVNGRVTVADGVATGDRPGTVLRSGRDSETVPLR